MARSSQDWNSSLGLELHPQTTHSHILKLWTLGLDCVVREQEITPCLCVGGWMAMVSVDGGPRCACLCPHPVQHVPIARVSNHPHREAWRLGVEWTVLGPAQGLDPHWSRDLGQGGNLAGQTPTKAPQLLSPASGQREGPWGTGLLLNLFCGSEPRCSQGLGSRAPRAPPGSSSLGLLDFLLPLPSPIPNEQLVCWPAWHQLPIPGAKCAEPAVCERDTVWLWGDRQAAAEED